MLDHTVPPPEPSAPSAVAVSDAPGTTLVERVIEATDELLRRICAAATDLLDDVLEVDDRHDAETAADELAQWLGSMGLAAEAGLTRQVQAALRDPGPGAGRALRIASLVDDIRNSVRLTVARPRDDADQELHVLAIGDETLASDAAIWVLASNFRCTAVTSQDPPDSFPDDCEAVVVLSARPPEPTLLEAVRERYPSALCVMRSDRSDLDAATCAWAESVLAPTTLPEDLLGEVRLQLAVRGAPLRVAVAGDEADGPGAALRGRGADVHVIGSVDDLEALAFADPDHAVEAVVVGADVDAVTADLLARRIHTDPRLRDIVVVHQTDDMASHLGAHRAVDVLLPADVARHEVAQLVEHLVRRVRRSAVRLGRGVATAPATTRIVLERLLVSAHRDGRTVSVATIRTDGSLDVANLVAELSAEFRTDDVVGRWDGDQVVVALRGLTRRVAVERVRSALARYEGPHRPIEAGVAEFPYDARSSIDLVAVATAAIDRSREADGPSVVAAEWRRDDEVAPDVMIVDPDHTLSSMLAGHLGDKGLEVVAIETGGEAVQWLIKDRRPAPRALLLEFNTPGLDGLALLRQLRRAGVLAHTRVLMLSATVRDDDLLAAFELGARDVVTKPFSMAVFDNRLNRVLDS